MFAHILSWFKGMLTKFFGWGILPLGTVVQLTEIELMTSERNELIFYDAYLDVYSANEKAIVGKHKETAQELFMFNKMDQWDPTLGVVVASCFTLRKIVYFKEIKLLDGSKRICAYCVIRAV